MTRRLVLETELARILGNVPRGTLVFGTLNTVPNQHTADGEGILVPLHESLIFYNGLGNHNFAYKDQVEVTPQPGKDGRRANLKGILIKTTRCAAFFANVSDGDVATFCLQVNNRLI